ncbi:MAG: glycosyltransferase family 1 protein, partial [Planctomycetota bacterium]|nr:glycosyltransferase family 1 protein [Planctomycetota bacterium]
MRILQLTPGTGDFLCGSCLRDNTLVSGLRDRGHDALIAPLYLPFALEDRGAGAPEPDGVESTIHMGGINVYLQQKLGLFR